MININIKQFDVIEDMNGVDLISNEEIIEKAESEDKEKIEKILTEYENFKKEVEKQVNDNETYFLEITCNGEEHNGINIIHLNHQKITILKEEIKKIEYFKGYTSAVRVELNLKTYFINAAIDDLPLIKYTKEIS